MIVVLIIAVVGVLAFWGWGIVGATLCPDVVGKPFNEAVKEIVKEGFRYEISYAYLKVHRGPKEDDEHFFERLEIIMQRPSPGVKVKPWRKVVVLYVTGRNSK